jgi:hypothetical protein
MASRNRSLSAAGSSTLIAASAASNFRGEISAINAEPMKRPGLAPSR